MLVTSLALMLGVYIAGVARLWNKAGVGHGVRPFEAAAFAGGWLAIVVALSPRMDELSDRWLFAHMVQHELLMVVAAPLLVLSAPLIAALWVFPDRLRLRLSAAVRQRPIVMVWGLVTAPLAVFLLHALALWIWHLPALYEYALEHESAHVVEHLCFIGTATLFWWGIAHGRYGRLGYGAAVVYAFATAVHSGVLGALLTLSPRAWYPHYSEPHAAGLTPLEDQQLAGLLMWIPAGLAVAAGGLALFAAWLRESDRRTRFATPASQRSRT
jgi:putative membrane protein